VQLPPLTAPPLVWALWYLEQGLWPLPIRDALDYRARFPDGRIGSDPAQASPEKGQRIIDASVTALLKDVADVAAEGLP